MKVVQINAVCEYGSTGRICVELSEYMDKNNIENYLFYGNGKSYFRNAKRMNSDFDVKLHGLLSRITGKQAYFSHRHTKRIIKELDKIKPDIVHLHNLHGNFIYLNMLLDYLAKKDIATVITLHDCWFFTGKCCYYIEDKCDGWLKECGNCPTLNKHNSSWFFDRTNVILHDKEKRFRAIPRLGVVGVSSWVSEDAKKSKVFKNAKIIKSIFNGIDLDLFRPHNTYNLRKKLNLDNKFIVFGIAQSWNATKGIYVFIELSKILSEEFVIVLAGKIDDNYDTKKIKCVGEIMDVNLLSDYYSMADVFINPSIQETFGMTTAEAISSGTPVIAYNATATPELVGYDEKCGYIIDENEADNYYEKIKIIKNNGKKFYTENCRNSAQKKFNKETNIKEYIELYETLMKI